ncbi:MAG: 4Fe-4S binding protein [Planctomycetales bacterium]|nr:4Fe-4S binding protein [Planctomycetales bacterium]
MDSRNTQDVTLPIVIEGSGSSRARKGGRILVRIFILGLVVAGLRLVAHHNLKLNTDRLLKLEEVFPWMPDVTSLELIRDTNRYHYRTASGIEGQLITNATEAEAIVGYSGSSRLLFRLDERHCVSAAVLLSCGDTEEHVNLVKGNAAYWQQFLGWELGRDETRNMDAVSGATLTSLAIAETAVQILSGRKTSLRFPREVELREVVSTFPGAKELVAVGSTADLTSVRNGRVIQGFVFRTGQLADSIPGYQGPSELLVFLDVDMVIVGVQLRSTFDNQPYTDYVRQERGFWKLFSGLTLLKLSDEEWASQIEGVSGATMTSQAIARTLSESARQLSKRRNSNPPDLGTWAKGVNHVEWLTLLLLGGAIVIDGLGLKCRQRWWCLQIGSLVVLGVITGNLLSIALYVGWLRGGVSVFQVPGLFLLLTVTVLWPLLTRRNIYCAHLCPHGILQQWQSKLLRRRGRRFSPSLKRAIVVLLKASRVAALVFMGLAIVSPWSFRLSALEPFESYALQFAWSVSLMVWLCSLLLSLVRPMGYCQHGCATGWVINVFRNVRSSRFSKTGDVVLVVLCACIWCLALFR